MEEVLKGKGKAAVELVGTGIVGIVPFVKEGKGMVRVVLSVIALVTVTKVVICGPDIDVGVAVVVGLEEAVLFGKKAPGTLAVTVLFGKKGVLRVMELGKLDDVRAGKEPFKEKVEVVKFG
jgi:hypothetical protein